VLYLLFRSPVVGGGPNRMLSRDLFGVPLGDHWLSGAGPLSAQGAVFLGILALLAAVSWLSVRVARRMPVTGPAPATPTGATPTGTKPARTKPARTKPARTKPAATPSEAAPPAGTGGALGAALKALPYLTVVIAAFAPLAAAVYLVVSTGWSVAERWAFARSRHKAQDGHKAQELTGAPPRAGHTLRERGH
jgi:YidC/Oxa1 family membrane protein insertase